VVTALFFIVLASTIIVSVWAGWPEGKSIVDLIELWMLVQGLLTGGFFGFNFGEHWAKAKQIQGS
jgi:hypothetical protein